MWQMLVEKEQRGQKGKTRMANITKFKYTRKSDETHAKASHESNIRR
jgi:hypothetical protein